MVILVTGGTGLVGSQLVEDLIARGHRPDNIRVLARHSSDTPFLEEKKVTLCHGDVTDVESLKLAVEGVDIVFHCAAAVDEKRKALFEEVNFKGTWRMLEAARLAHVKKFIHVSSIGVYGLLRTFPASEEHPKQPLRPYAVAKLAAEGKVWEYHQPHGLQCVILRPTAVVGERDRTITKHIVNLARKRIVPLVGGGKARVSFIHVKDLTEAMIRCSEAEQAVGKAYNVEGFAAPLHEVLRLAIDMVGSHARIVSIPYPLAYTGALLIDGFFAMALPTRPPLRARKGILQLTRDLVFDTTKIRHDLRFRPRFGMEESLREAIQWQLHHG